LKRERSLLEVHIVRIKEKGVRKIGKILQEFRRSLVVVKVK